MLVECRECGSTRFHLHVPPKHAKKSLKQVYLVCDGCGKLWRIIGFVLDKENKLVMKELKEAEGNE